MKQQLKKNTGQQRKFFRDAVERYLRERHPLAADSQNGLAAAEQLRELRKGTLLPEGVAIRDLINEDRA